MYVCMYAARHAIGLRLMWLGSHVAWIWKKAVAIHNIIATHELHLCAKTILNENYRCVSTNLHSPYATCFKIKAKKPWGKWPTWKLPSSRLWNANFKPRTLTAGTWSRDFLTLTCLTCFKIKAKKPWGKWPTWKLPFSRLKRELQTANLDGGNLVTWLLWRWHVWHVSK